MLRDFVLCFFPFSFFHDDYRWQKTDGLLSSLKTIWSLLCASGFQSTTEIFFKAYYSARKKIFISILPAQWYTWLHALCLILSWKEKRRFVIHKHFDSYIFNYTWQNRSIKLLISTSTFDNGQQFLRFLFFNVFIDNYFTTFCFI